MNTAEEFFDEFLNIRKDLSELVYDGSSSRVYEADSDISHQMNLHLYDSNDNNYFDIEINVSALKEDNSSKQVEYTRVHILKDGYDKGKICLGTYDDWPSYCFISVNKTKKAIYDIGKEYGIDSDFLDFTCDLIKIIHNHCLSYNNRKKR